MLLFLKGLPGISLPSYIRVAWRWAAGGGAPVERDGRLP